MVTSICSGVVWYRIVAHPVKSMREPICYHPIGIIHTPFRERAGMPIQAVGGEDCSGCVEVFPEYAGGLKDVEGFSRIILIYHFNQSGTCRLQVVPFLDTLPHGVFSTRAPDRPNPLGLSVVRLTRKEGNCLHIKGVDMLDGTPLLDIKPYLPDCDSFEGERTGWLSERGALLKAVRSDDRFSPCGDAVK